MKFIAIIPARYASTRFPGKPLAMLGGKPIIQRVCEQARAVFDRVLVATDDTRIAECVDNFGGKAVMTRPDHRSGTDRCFEAYEKAGEDCDVVVNVQGDEPFIAPQQLKAVCHCFDNPATDIATLVMPFAPTATWTRSRTQTARKSSSAQVAAHSISADPSSLTSVAASTRNGHDVTRSSSTSGYTPTAPKCSNASQHSLPRLLKWRSHSNSYVGSKPDIPSRQLKRTPQPSESTRQPT